ncbi:hypothetical protein [Eisenibacter elegans]|uniref:hypothetical protein n=1 Tax=Eisenibacter elegans TaxID=997 RepID=UPI00040AA2A7|nr:hypothetical protein [Eisenibacter elegans]
MFRVVVYCTLAISLLAGRLFGQERIIHSPSGVEVIFVLEDNMFPESWRKSPINAEARPIAPAEVARTIRVVEQALDKYPAEMLKRHLGKVYVCEYLAFYGQTFGGTNSRTNVYLSNGGVKKGYTDHCIEQLFHAEFSSILLRNHPQFWDEKGWLMAKDPQTAYGKGSGVEAIRDGVSSTTFSPEWHKRGFLYQYANSSIENDFNSFAKQIFCPEAKFWQVVEAYPYLAQKNTLAIAFYQKIHPQFTHTYFKAFEKK